MNTEHYKKLLLTEKKRLSQELESVGYLNPKNKLDWLPKRTDMDKERSDVIDTADNLEEFSENNAIINELEVRMNNVDAAIVRIETNLYGNCVECGNVIEKDRLEANPAAATCKTCMK